MTTTAEDAPSHRSRWRWLAPLIVVVAVIAGVVIWASVQAGHYYAFEPGSAPQITLSRQCRASSGSGSLSLPDGKPCAQLTVPLSKAHPIAGQLLMVDVLVGKATPADYLLEKLGLLNTFHHGAQLVPAAAVLGTTPASQLACQDAQQMVQATSTAPIVALERLGYDVRQVNLGAQVDLVVPGSAAAEAGVHCDDLLTAVDGTTVRTEQDVTAALAGKAPGTDVRLTVQRTVDGKVETKELTAKLGHRPGDAAEGFLGVALETRTVTKLPFDVTIDVGNIGGPSAGLALTLGILDVLSSGHLTGGHIVAATGTISPDGAVGDVGGVAQKAVAVQRAGATLFLVPVQELKAAESEAGPHLKVVAVSTLEQALNALQAIGGTVPPPTTPVAH